MTTTPPPVSKVPKAARTAAGAFILAAAGREDLAKAWQLSHPELREACGCTYKQWLTGNIPVQPFPTSGLQGVSYFVDELAPRRVVLQVLLRPAAGSDLTDQAFHIGLKAVGNGQGPGVARRPLVADLAGPDPARLVRKTEIPERGFRSRERLKTPLWTWCGRYPRV